MTHTDVGFTDAQKVDPPVIATYVLIFLATVIVSYVWAAEIV